ncbi:MAG: hypothetical protein WBG54_15725 [Acidobacteriaceae bacterium]
MKTTLRTLVLAGVVALMTAAAAMPAHATTGGSSPRPAPGSGSGTGTN